MKVKVTLGVVQMTQMRKDMNSTPDSNPLYHLSRIYETRYYSVCMSGEDGYGINTHTFCNHPFTIM